MSEQMKKETAAKNTAPITVTQLVTRLLTAKSITAEEAVLLLKMEMENNRPLVITTIEPYFYPSINPNTSPFISNPTWGQNPVTFGSISANTPKIPPYEFTSSGDGHLYARGCEIKSTKNGKE